MDKEGRTAQTNVEVEREKLVGKRAEESATPRESERAPDSAQQEMSDVPPEKSRLKTGPRGLPLMPSRGGLVTSELIKELENED